MVTITVRTFPRLQTDRLILREIEMDDTEAVFRHLSNGEVTKYMDIEPLAAPEEAEEIIRFCQDLFERGAGIRWGIELKEETRLVGTCGFNTWIKTGARRAEIGYDLSRDYWGRGIMNEALRAVIDYGFKQMNFNRLEALVDVANGRSMRVLRRLGFQREGVLREYMYYKGKFWDEVCFSLLQREWPVNQDEA